jgi:hypothetical protein
VIRVKISTLANQNRGLEASRPRKKVTDFHVREGVGGWC